MSGQDTVDAFTSPIPSLHSIKGLSAIEIEARSWPPLLFSSIL